MEENKEELNRLILDAENKTNSQILDCPEVFIGQEKLIEKINILIDRVTPSQKALPHMLFVGEDGMGKETLAKFITKKINSNFISEPAASIVRVGDFIGALTNLEARDILFISDIEKLSKPVIEFLIPALSKYRIDFIVDKGPFAKRIDFILKPFTLIATTAQLSKVNKDVLSYFLINYSFEPYTHSQINQIIENKVKAHGLTLEPELLNNLILKTQDAPVDIMFLINKAIVYANSFDVKVLSRAVIEETIKISGYQPKKDVKVVDRAISDEVRLKVWRRDEGKCVKCGSQEKLEYDHIIPVAKGGSNTERNVQLLCEKCNRSKSDNI